MKKLYKIVMGIMWCFCGLLVISCGAILIYSMTDHDTSKQIAGSQKESLQNEEVAMEDNVSITAETTETTEIATTQIPDYENYTELICENNENPMYYRYVSVDGIIYVEGYWTVENTLVYFNGEELTELDVNDMSGKSLDIRIVIMDGLSYNGPVRVWTTNNIKDYENYTYINPKQNNTNDEENVENEVSINSNSKMEFFLNNIVGLTPEEVIAGMGEPSTSNTTYGTSFFYEDFEVYGMYGKITIEFEHGVVDYAHWDLRDINVQDYANEISQIQDYFNERYFYVDTNDWKQDKTEISIVGLKTGEYIRLLFD